MNDPHVVPIVHRQADGLAEDPVVGHGLGPERIHFEPWSLLGLGRGPIEHCLADAETDQQGHQGEPYEFP